MRALILGGLFLLLGCVAQADAGEPGRLVEARSRAVLKELTARRNEFKGNPSSLHSFVRGELSAIFDREYSARLVLGRHSRGMPQEKITAFADALTENLLKRYGDALLDVDPGVEVDVKSETPLRGGKIVRVSSEILRRSGPPVPVDYLFRETAQGWLAFDVIVEGVSYVQTYRSQFDELLRNESIDALTAKLASGAIAAGAE
ncbi:MlaC/ttg2D family ABC transporter substrate-binding protein [Pseudomarimonas salicorniae]|uniref:ABC transporter substrate-binding protein n=1 Tax=Pseudomarimonas salicorniae TaxID=2933270 RepID=A0ABT0GD09_9GAMM|nr:ABC transporter substrate-binding protein [Lysobacter sp. CAU 1642]MCK7592318.1 ABC transporter substrate-binding protein [Lysobacter sp. CAU 1642]